ncbi:protein D2-like [Coccinella septempunctata]|uniref:protein D2-like n=1 Tax=Coccinella septempunctata TaxID=41139 RepID=UPI001D06CFC6|nr:protein D2-like [Coccinella septempunctata]
MKVLILLSVFGVTFSTLVENVLDAADNLTDVQEAFMKYGLDTKLPHLPPNKLIVHYDTDIKVNLGTEFDIKTIVQAPNVIFEADPDAHYTLIMIDVDSPTREKPFFGQLLIWKVVNIPGSKVHKGETVAEYSAHAPWKRGEAHRYVLLLFKQHHKQVFGDSFQSAFRTFHRRIGFSAVKFSMKYGLGRPIAGNFFQLKAEGTVGNEIFRHHHLSHHH